jgi:flagellar basal-body rod modification protein FlgD
MSDTQIAAQAAAQGAAGQAGSAQAAGASGATKTGGLNGQAKLADDFDTFLNLLVTQLKNQDPLEPMKSEEFTNQLVQFSSVEQAIATNEKLDQMLQAQAGNRATQAVNFIGKEVEMQSDRLVLQDGTADLSYTLEEEAAQGSVLISDDSGQILRSLPIETRAGRHELTWDGTGDSGQTLADGVYTVQVRAVDQEDATLPTSVATRGTVTGFEIRDDAIHLDLNGLDVPFDQVRAVHDGTNQTG